MWKLRFERAIRSRQQRSQRLRADALAPNVRLQSRPARESAFAGDHTLRIVQRHDVRASGRRPSPFESAKRVRFLRLDGLQQRTCPFALVFEIEPGQSILLLCLCPLSRPKEVRWIALSENEQVGDALSADGARPETR
jgi:hypothetical protein